MEINIVSGKFQFDGDESGDIDFNVSKLIVQMELSEMSKLGRIPENFNCSFVFSWTDPHPTNNRPIIARVDHKCSETILSKELESAVNDRLLKIQNSDVMEFYYEKTDEDLLNKIKHLPQAIELNRQITEQKMFYQPPTGYNENEDILIEPLDNAIRVQCLLMAVCNNQIHSDAAQRVLTLLEKV